MSLDIYVGSLSKYYCRDFETPQARFAREENISYQLIYAGDAPKWLSKKDAPATIENFRKTIADHTQAEMATNWREDIEEYFAEQLFDEARNALVMVAAYQNRLDLQRPLKMPENYQDDPAISEAYEKKYYFGSMAILESALWLTGDEALMCAIKDPMGWDIFVNTQGNLQRTLNELAKEVWSDRVDVEGWFLRGVAPKQGGVTMHKRKIRLPWQSKYKEEREKEPENSLMWNAEYAFSVFWKALEFAKRLRVPIRLDG